MSNKITCTCGHSWNKSSSSKKDMKICHICGKDNTMKNGGWLDSYDEELQLGGYVYPVNYVPQAQKGTSVADNTTVKKPIVQNPIGFANDPDVIKYNKVKNDPNWGEPYKFLTNWYTHPETQKRLKTQGAPAKPMTEALNQKRYDTYLDWYFAAKDKNRKDAENIWKDDYSRATKLSDFLNQGLDTKYDDLRDNTTGFHVSSDSLVALNSSIYPDKEKMYKTAVHELTHATPLDDFYVDYFKKNKPKNSSGSEAQYFSENPTEIYPRIQDLRYQMWKDKKIAPGTKITPEMLDGYDNDSSANLRNYYSPEELAKIMNDVAYESNNKKPIRQAENGIEGTMGGLTDIGFNYNGAWGGTMQMGGSMPGSVGFTYARTGGIPSNGPYAKKTKASAQDGEEVEYKELPEITVVGSKDKQTRDFYNNLIDNIGYDIIHSVSPESSKKEIIDFLHDPSVLKSNPELEKDIIGTYEGIMNLGKKYGFPKVNPEDRKGIFSNARGHYSPLTKTIYANSPEVWISELAHHVQMKDDLVNKGLQWLGNDLIEYIKHPISLIKGEKISGPYKKEGAVEHEAHSIIEPKLKAEFQKIHDKYQNGGEMKFYQEGLDWTPKNISRDGSEIPQAQLGLHMLTPDYSQVGENIMEMLSVPQKALTKLFSGKYQTPSEAMNIKNPVGAFAVDAILDPANIVGGTAVSKIAKAATKASKVAKPAVSSAVKNVVNKTKNLEDLQSAQKFAKGYGYKLPENLERIAQSDELTNRTVRGLMNRHNTFVRGVSTNWDVLAEKNPEILRHLESKGIDWKNNPKAAAEYMATHVPIQTGYGRASLNQEVFKKGLDAIYTSNSIPTAEGYTYGQGYITKVKKPTDFSSPNRQDWITKNNPEYYEHSLPAPVSRTELDELKGWQGSDPYSMFNTNKLGSEENAKKVHAWLDDFYNKEVELRKTYGIDNSNKGDYHLGLDESGKEITMKHPNFQKLRRQKVEDVNAFRKKIDEVYNKTMDDTWKTLVPVDEVNFTKKLLKTEHPSNLETNIDKYAHYLHLGTPGEKVLEPIKSWEITPEIWKNKSRAHTNVYTKKLSALEEGGEITKDDNGYWNPDNWGEPVEIGSNKITMQGVYEPLLGISDTGDTQMMYPGEDYEFDGESVTEYPVMQKGGRVPVYTDNLKDPRIRAYNDSLSLYNQTQYNLKPYKKNGYTSSLLEKDFHSYWPSEISSMKTNPNDIRWYARASENQSPTGTGETSTWDKGFKNKVNTKILPIGEYMLMAGDNARDYIPKYKKPVQPVVYKKPEPKVEPKKPEPKPQQETKKDPVVPISKMETPTTLNKTVPNLPYRVDYSGNSQYFASDKEGEEFIKNLNKDFMENKISSPGNVSGYYETKKKKNGGWLEKYK